MKKTTIGAALILSGVFMGMWLMSNFNLPSWLGGHPNSVVLGRKLDQPIQAVDMTRTTDTFKQVAQMVKQSVVYIQVVTPKKRNTKSSGNNFQPFNQKEDGFLDNLLEETAGSGVIMSKEGYIVTNYHVIENGRRITVLLEDKREYEAQLVGSDPSTDLAVIKIPASPDLPVAPLGDDRTLSVGDWVVAIGSPFRLTSTVTAGIVSAMGRQINIIDKSNFPIEDFIQTDAAINPGNSGGALVNLKGELVGINSAIATDSGSYEGYGFAVPVGLMARITRDLIQYGNVKRGYLGVLMDAVDAEYAEQLGMSRIQGVLVTDLVPNAAAQRAGIYPGDVILKVNGVSVNQENELQRAITMSKPGDTVSLYIWRFGQEQEFKVKLDLLEPNKQRSNISALNSPLMPPSLQEQERPTLLPKTAVEPSAFGIQVRALKNEDMKKFGVSSGVVITSLEHGKPAKQAQLPLEGVILSIEKVPVRSEIQFLNTLKQMSANAEALLFQIRKADGTTGFYEVRIPR